MTRPISFEDIARLPLPGTAVPVQVSFGPDDRVVTFLHSPELTLERRLFVLSLEADGATAIEVTLGEGIVTSEDDLGIEEKLRRERAREIGLGVTSATWAEKGDVLMVPLPDGLRVVRGLGGAPHRAEVVLVARSDGGPIEDPRLSPDGSQVAFVRRGDVYVLPTTGGGQPLRLTTTATDGVFNGLAEFVAQEEMGRPHGLWWSPDGTRLAYTEVDEREIPVYRIVHQGSDALGSGEFEDHRYPFAGEANAKVRLGVMAAGGGETVWLDTGHDDHYLARVHWLAGGGLVAEIEARDQRSLNIVRFDTASGTATELFSETSDVWLNLHDDFRALLEPLDGEAGVFVWSSERTGFRHLELRARDGSLLRVLTEGDWAVDRLEGVDEHAGLAYFTGTRDGATERHLYSVPLAGGRVRRLTPEPGVHDVVLSQSGRLFADCHSSLASPPKVTLRATGDGSVLQALHDGVDPRLATLALEPPELVSIPAPDGTELHGLVFTAAEGAGDSSPSGTPPLVVHVYGGPHLQLAQNSWASTVMMRAQALARLGCTVLALDNRGSARRGLAFESAIKNLTGHVELEDQLAGVRWMVEQGRAAADRVGVYGWSYGGYMSLMCLARAPEVFQAAVAGAPVTHFGGYDTHYTERYLETPESNPAGYEEGSVLAHAAGITGRLLLVHGLIDENVHFRHTARLLNRLVRARVPYSLLLFPDERHLPRKLEDRAYMEEQVVTWLLDALR